MKKLLLTILAFGLLSSSAFAQEGLEKKQFTRVVASGTKTRIGFFYALHPDCTASGNVDIRVTTWQRRDYSYNQFPQLLKRKHPLQVQ